MKNANISRARADARALRLVRYKRWLEAERAIIYYGRVERFLRSSFASEEWKRLGVADRISGGDVLSKYVGCLFMPCFWGCAGGVLIMGVKQDAKKHATKPIVLGECNLLSLLAFESNLNLAVSSETERAEMCRLKAIISMPELYLANYYGQYFSVPRDLSKPYHGDKNAMQPVAVIPFRLNPYEGTKIVFHGKERGPQFILTRVESEGRTLLLPTTYYASAVNPTLSCMMPEVPDSPSFYNSDAIAATPQAEVILSDEIAIPIVNDSDEDVIYSSWYGGMEVVEYLDFGALHGHRVVWLCYDNSVDLAEKFRVALRIAAICENHEISIEFLLVEHITWAENSLGMEMGQYECVKRLSCTQLMEEAAAHGVGNDGARDRRVLSMDELLSIKERNFVLYPVLKAGFYCLIYGGSGVAKTWFSLHLAIALSQGETPFAKWEFRGKPMNVLYVAGEMEEDEYGKRVSNLLADRCANPRFLLFRDDLDLTTVEGQENVAAVIRGHGSSAVFFDNLSTLASNGHTEGQFEKILQFFKQLQRQDIIVVLVHHENREGSFKGSGKIELAADQSLHLFHTGNGDKIELLVQAEKIRMTSRNEQCAFRTEFDPKNPVAVWPIFPLNEEERRRLNEDDPLDEVGGNIGKKRNNQRRAWVYLDDDERAIAIIDDMLTGCLDDVIAANLAVRTCAVSEFKTQYGISEEILKRHLPKAKKITEDRCGKTSPDVLAPVLWELLKNDTVRI